jgi:hypothetical protein
MLALSIQIFVWTWLIVIGLGALVLLGLAAALAGWLVHAWQQHRRLSAHAPSPCSAIADPWHGFQHSSLRSTDWSARCRFTLPLRTQFRDGLLDHQPGNHGNARGGLNIELDSPDAPNS